MDETNPGQGTPAEAPLPLEYSAPRAALGIRTTIVLSRLVFAVALAWVLLVVAAIVFRFGNWFMIIACAASAVLLAIGARYVAPPNDVEARRVARRAVWVGALPAVLTLIASFVALPSPGPRAPAYRVQCASHLRQIGQAVQMYANDYPGPLPPSFDYLITTEEIEADAFVCPRSSDAVATGPTSRAVAAAVVGSPGHCSYVYAGAGLSSQSLTKNHVLAYEPMKNHGNDGMNVLFGDGRVEFVAKPKADHLLSELAAGHNPPR